jgi:hypothetical protein
MIESFTYGQKAIWASGARSIATLQTRKIRKMDLRQFFRSFSVAVFVFVFAAGLQAQPTAHLTLHDLLSFEPVGDYALSPDGKTIALTRAGQIVLLPSGEGWHVLLTSTQGGISGLDWSPDSKQIAYASGQHLGCVRSGRGSAPSYERTSGRRRSASGNRPLAPLVPEGTLDPLSKRTARHQQPSRRQ